MTYKFVKCDCLIYFFLNSESAICRSTDTSECLKGPLDFEIMRETVSLSKASIEYHKTNLYMFS